MTATRQLDSSVIDQRNYRMSKLKASLTEKILGIAGVSEKHFPTASGGFTSFIYKNIEFAHFHPTDEIDLKLTKKVIASEKVKHPKHSAVHPKRSSGSPWIELRFSSAKEVNEVFRLVKLATEKI